MRQIRLDWDTEETWIATSQGAFFQEPFDPSEDPGWTFVAGLPSRDLTTVLPLYYDVAFWLGTRDAGVIYFQPASED